MKILADTNILLRLANAADPQHVLASNAATKLFTANEELFVVPQNIYEFWSAATRPTSVNGLGLTVSQAKAEVYRLRTFFDLLDEKADIYAEWKRLVDQYLIVGKNAHDTRLVAAMIVHGITHLLTFNKQDFQRFTNITAITPADVMAMP